MHIPLLLVMYLHQMINLSVDIQTVPVDAL